MLIHQVSIDLASLLTGLGALAILMLIARIHIGMISALIALVIPTVVVVLAGGGSVAGPRRGEIPRGIPLPHLPDVGLFSFSLVTGALAQPSATLPARRRTRARR